MRVLHLDSGREMRGGQRQLALLAGVLADYGVEQEVLARGALRERLGCRELTLLAVLHLGGWADLLHAHDARAHTLAALLRPDIPLVVSRRVGFPPKRTAASRWKYRRPRKILAVSEFVSRQLIGSGAPKERVEVVYDGAIPPRIEPTYREPLDPPRVLALDSDDPLKGSRLAREACGQANLCLRLTRNLEADLPSTDLFLYLSENEGLGSALLAASLAKKPIVATGIGGIPEIVRHGETGLLTSNRVAEIASHLRRFAEDRELARACAEAAYRQARQRFSADTMGQRTIAAYRAVLAR